MITHPLRVRWHNRPNGTALLQGTSPNKANPCACITTDNPSLTITKTG